MAFNNPSGLYALLALIPFILLYLRRPKPKEKTIPSLMFFMREKGVTKFSNLFKQILRNLLFLLQLLILLAAAFAAAAPFFETDKASSAQHTVIVIDASASMNALLAGSSQTRFERAVEKASAEVSGTTSIVAAANIPVVVLEKGTAAQARKTLAALQALHTATQVGDAMIAGGELVEDAAKSRMVVLSDFQSVEGTDVLVAKRSLSARGMHVSLASIPEGSTEGLTNTGFVELSMNKFETTALIRNYDSAPRTVDVEVRNSGKKIGTETVILGPRSIEPVSFDTLHGSTELEIMRNDDFAIDNKAYLSSPAKKISAMLITNSDASYLMAALKSLPTVQLDVAFPPVVKRFDYDVIIIHNASSQLMLPGFYKEINRAAANGTGLVITAQDSLPAYVKQFSMPVAVGQLKNSSKANTKIENYLTKGVDFGVVTSYYALTPAKGSKAQITPLVVADDESVLIGTYPHGSGLAVYYGLLDDKSTFKSSYLYPIFWDNLLSFATRSEDIASFNVLTGRVEGISGQEVATPAGKITTSRLFYDRAGFYSVGPKTIAANLLDKEESDITASGQQSIIEGDARLATTGQEAKGELFFDSKLITLALALLLAELLLVKMRGDI